MGRLDCMECFSQTCIGKSCTGTNSINARYIYGIIFLLTNLIAWMIRDYSHKALSSLHYLEGCGGGHDCLGTEGVLRVSLGCFVFFFTMYLTTVGTTKAEDPRDAWHSGWWPLKSVIWIVVMILPFFVPSAFIQVYGEMARFGAGVFLVIQLLSIMNFIYCWNGEWLSEKNSRRCRIPLIVVAVGSYGLSAAGLILMYIWFAPRPSCGLNIFFITWTLILIIVMTSISLHSKVDAGLLTSGLVSLYIVFLCWSSIMSEPVTETCNTRPRQTGKADWLTVLSFLLAFFAIILATFSTGIDSKSCELPKQDESEKSEIPYSYGFFHFVFAMGAMYFAMLFVGWNLHQSMHRWSIDVGWASVWVKMVNEWLAAIVYIWTMVCVFVFKDRDFSPTN